MWSWEMTKIRSVTKLYCTLFIYLICEYSKRFVEPVVQTVVQTAAKCERTCDRHRASGDSWYHATYYYPGMFNNFRIARPKYCFILCTPAIWQLWLNEYVMLCQHSVGRAGRCQRDGCVCRGVARSKYVEWTDMASAEREPLTGGWRRSDPPYPFPQ